MAEWKQIAWSNETMTNPATADLDMADYAIIGVNDIKAFDIAGIICKDSNATTKISLASSTYSFAADANATMGNNIIRGMGNGVLDGDAIRKDQALLLDGTHAMTADLDMDQNAIDAMVFENLAAAPHSGTEVQGEVYYNTADDHLHVWVA